MDYIHHFLTTIFNAASKKGQRYVSLAFLRYTWLEFIETYLKSFEAPSQAAPPAQPGVQAAKAFLRSQANAQQPSHILPRL